jgi:hypothetical protein
MLIKVHKDLLTYAVQGRTVVDTYATNRTVKIVAFYCLLKSVTSTGVIHNVTEQPELRKLTKYSRNSFKSLVQDLISSGLATISKGNLKLVSWSSAVESTGLEYKPSFTYINYNEENTTKFYYSFLPAEIANKKAAQEAAVIKRLESNLKLKKATDNLIKQLYKVDPSTLSSTQYLDAVYFIQNYQYTSGTITSDLVRFNPDLNRSASKLKADWKFKSTLSITYWKRKLQELGLIIVENVGKLIGKKNNRLRDHGLQDRYCKEVKSPVWYRVDRITVL